MELEDHLHKLNSKFTNYINMMAGIGEDRTPIIQKYLQEPNEPQTKEDTPNNYEYLVKKLN
jgi:hypothetical protein